MRNQKPFDVMYFFCPDWEHVVGRGHQVTRRLAKKGYRVLYVEEPSSILTAIVVRRKRGRLRHPLGWLRQLETNTFLLTPPLLLPFSNEIPPIKYINCRILGSFLMRALHKLHFDSIICWIYHPFAVNFTSLVEPKIICYDCVDDYARWPGTGKLTARAVRKDENKLLRQADVIFTVSKTLYEPRKLVNPNTFLIPNGVEVEHFLKSRSLNLPLPDDIKHITKPIIGFAGVIHSFLDLDLIEYIAKARREWSVVMVGPVEQNISRFNNLTNVYFLGLKPYSLLPNYLKGMDVCIVPWTTAEVAVAANPAKIFQYLACGKPIVASPSPELDGLSDIVKVAKNGEEFIKCISEALSEDNQELVSTRIKIAKENTWDQRVERMLEIIYQLLNESNLLVENRRAKRGESEKD